MSNPDTNDRIIDKTEGEAALYSDKSAEDILLGVDAALKAEEKQVSAKPTSRFIKNPMGTASQTVAAVKAAEASDTDEKVTVERIKALEAELKRLAAGADGVTLKEASVKKATIDWSKISEKDVFDLDIPIDAVVMDIPDYAEIHLKDPSYVARWVHKMPRRLGPMLAMGYTYVEDQDLEVPMKLTDSKDANGHYTLDDVIAMKISKVKYFGHLRRNYLRSQMKINPKGAHQLAKKEVESMMQEGPLKKSYDKYTSQGKLGVYTPGFEV